MPSPRALAIPLSALLCAVSLSACAGECAPAVSGGWIRKPPADLPMLAGYARIANPCSDEVVVVSARSPAFAEVSLHATLVEGGISRMRPAGELRIAAGTSAELVPGGMHLMLMQPTRKLRDGEVVEIRFELADGREVRGGFTVKGPRAVKAD
jgi:copper(I)-binding protein